MPVEPGIIELATSDNFAVLTTLFEDGHPQSQVMWIDADEEHILINTEVHRAKFANMQADPRVTVTIIDASNSYSYAEVRGRVVDTVTGPEARAHIDKLAQRYVKRDYVEANITSERVIVKIAPDRQILR